MTITHACELYTSYVRDEQGHVGGKGEADDVMWSSVVSLWWQKGDREVLL